MVRPLRDLPFEVPAAGGTKGLGTSEAGILGWGSEIIGGSRSYSVFVTWIPRECEVPTRDKAQSFVRPSNLALSLLNEARRSTEQLCRKVEPTVG